MARLDALPSIDIIHGFRGILDFYLWKGLPCVRKWPVTPPSRVNPATRTAAALFGAVIKAYSLLGATHKAAFAEDAADQPRTARDIYITAVFGHLHEASMSDFLTLLTECRDFLSNLTDLLHALDSVDTDELVVNVDESALPAGASTAANQATIVTALQKLDDLQDALQSVDTDALQVRGRDQLHSFKSGLHSVIIGAVSGAGGYLDSHSPSAGEVWIVTNILALDASNATTSHIYQKRATDYDFHFARETQAFAAAEPSFFHGWLWLEPTDVVRVTFAGSLVGDTCQLTLTGHVMTLET